MVADGGTAHDKRVDRVLALIDAQDLTGMRAALALLTDGQRRQAAAAADAWSRNLRAEHVPLQSGRRWGEIVWPLACAAVVGTFSAPAAAGVALLRVDRQCQAFFLPADLMIDVARERGLSWLPDLAGQLAASFGGYSAGWVGLDRILRAYQAPAPAGEAFVIGWLSTAARTGSQRLTPGPTPAQQADWLQASPYLRDLLPRVFEAEGAWRELESQESWRGLMELSRREPEFRPQLLDGCLRRIMLGGTAPALRPFGMLWSELAPQDGEVAARIPAYTAVAGSAAPGLATRAVKALHALAGQGRLRLDDLLDLSAVVLARQEKALPTAQLRMLDQAATRHLGRLPDILAAVEPASEHGMPDVRAAAARILRKHAASAPAGTGEKMAAIADATDASVRAEAAEDRAGAWPAGGHRAPPAPRTGTA